MDMPLTQQQEATMPGKVKPVPEGYHTITPSLAVRDADRAIAFYQKAFGAEERFRMPGPDGKIIHAELKIGDSMIMLSEERLEMDVKGPKTLGGTPVGFYVYVEDVDREWKRAVDAGASTVMPLADMFWGDRTGCVEDPFGHRWWLSQHIADLSPEEIQKGQEAFFSGAHSAS
jgi:PhnB protein